MTQDIYCGSRIQGPDFLPSQIPDPEVKKTLGYFIIFDINREYPNPYLYTMLTNSIARNLRIRSDHTGNQENAR
jgi:hypothetical protein